MRDEEKALGGWKLETEGRKVIGAGAARQSKKSLGRRAAVIGGGLRERIRSSMFNSQGTRRKTPNAEHRMSNVEVQRVIAVQAMDRDRSAFLTRMRKTW
jgi:hypothetical protein